MSTIDKPAGRHPVNIGHLVMGLALLGIVGIWALVQTDTVTGDDIRWLMPIPWVFAGAVGLAVTAVTGSRRYAVRQVGWVGDQPGRPVTPETFEEPTFDEPASEEIPETAPLTVQPDPEPDPDPNPQEKS